MSIDVCGIDRRMKYEYEHVSIDVCGIDRRMSMMDQEIRGDARAHAHTSSQAFTITSPRLILVLALTDTSVYVRMHGHRCVNLVTDA